MNLSELIKPTDRQREFFKALDAHKYTLYGGAKGGGKSFILRWALVRQLMKWAGEGHRGVRAGLFCEDYTTLKDRQISKIQYEFPQWLGIMRNSQIEGMSFQLEDKWGGGVIALRNLDDVSKYASSEFAMVAIDELTKNPRIVFDQFRGIIRWPGLEDTKFIAATNPGDIGHDWVKKIFVDRNLGPEDPAPNEVAFIKSLPTDNPHNAQSYLDELKRLPEKLRKAYLEGNWDVFEGQYFSEWDKEHHVVDPARFPFGIPPTWLKYRSIDPSGREGITSCHWYAVDSNGRVWVYREYYWGPNVPGCNGEGRDYDQHAKAIAKLSRDADGIEETYQYTIIDTAAFAKAGYSETAVEVFERNGVSGLIPAAKERVLGWNAVHTYLRWERHKSNEGYTQPMLQVFSTCANLIRTLPLLIHDEHHPEDVDSRGEDHAADELRYFLRTLREVKAPKPQSPVERRLQVLRERNSNSSFNYQYSRNK